MTRKEFLFSLTGLATGPLISWKLIAAENTGSTRFSHIESLDLSARAADESNTPGSLGTLTQDVLDFPHSFPIPPAVKMICHPRLVNAEVAFRKSMNPGVHEEELVSLLNDTAQALDAPDFAKMNQHELRVIRVRLLRDNPVFMGHGITHANARPGESINPYMSPLQAIHLSLMTADQKFLNEEFQYDPPTWEMHYMQRKAQSIARINQLAATTVLDATAVTSPGAFARSNDKGQELSARVNQKIGAMSAADIVGLASPGGTFTVETIFQPLTGLSYSVPGINISGNWQSDLAGAQGSAAPVNGTTNSNALAVFLGSRAPATWKFTWNTPAPDSGCRGVSVILTISAPQGAGVFGCAEVIAEAPLLRISPSTINIANPPETVVISNASHGGFRYISAMPESQYIDDSGIIEGISDASTISSDGTSMTGFTPDVSSAALGTYAGIAGNVSGSSLDVVGGGSVHLINQPVKCNPNCPP